MIGTKLAHYEITSHLGSGGMGDVYQATDSKLGRSVAVKLLPEAFMHDADRAARFEREARLLASLNHSNIAAIHGIEESGGRKFLVMELVPGETLAERIKRGPIPIDEALPIGKQIAEALEAAHEKGIIHRDLKPANIKITPQGQVKVLDFGLAKAFAGEAAEVNLSNSPTMMSSTPGMILGTAAYMSPAQAKGKETDRSTDIWAFGCVLYEMLTGRTAFEGETLGEILGAVFKAEPDWKRLPVETPAAIQRLLRRALKKDARQRLADIRDARLEIEEAQSESPLDSKVQPFASRRKERVAWISALGLVMLIAGIALVLVRDRIPLVATVHEMRLDIATPPTSTPTSLAISPDGQQVVFTAAAEGRSQLWLRSLDSLSTRPLMGAEGASLPFWSPDGRSIGFFADGKLKRIDADGSSLRVLANAPLGRGGAWGGNDLILFTPNPGGPIFRVSASGGEAVAVTRLEPQQENHRYPQFLPDGRHFVYLATTGRKIYVAQIDEPGTKWILDADSNAIYVAPGQLLFIRQGTLFAQDFDVHRLEVTGNPIALPDDVGLDSTRLAGMSASAAGAIVYRSFSGVSQRQYVWFDRSGKETGRVGDIDSAAAPELSLSADGQRLALSRTVDGNRDIWLLDTKNGVRSRFTFDVGLEDNPIWSPDGGHIVFVSNRNVASGRFGLYQKPVSGGRNEELFLETAQTKQVTDWSSDGRFLLFQSLDPKTSYDLWAVPVGGDRKPVTFLQTNFDEKAGQFSADAKWVAYVSNESGRFEVYIQPFPATGAKWQISTNGGEQVRWRHDGRELFYIAPSGELMAAPIRLSADRESIEAGAAVPLFATHLAVGQGNSPQYVVSSDGQRFLLNTVQAEASSPITMVLNWKPKP